MNIYFNRYAWREIIFPDFTPDPDLELIIVIPCHKEPSIEKALLSLNACDFIGRFLVMVVVNEALGCEHIEVIDQNKSTLKKIESLTSVINYPLLVSHQRLPDKKAGVGLARKIGMDEAARIFESIEKDGIIVCYDADCTCEPNYLSSIRDFYATSNNECGIVHYEHDLSMNHEAILNYEIYLRYYIGSLRWSGFPYAYQTLGSCITVKSKRYQKAGGMNTRKAGEDFYFLHKVIPNGLFGEINDTAIHPSSRISDRVPFGTGHAIAKYLDTTENEYLTYSPQIFQDLHLFLSDPFSKEKPKSVAEFLRSLSFDEAVAKMNKQATDDTSLRNRFFEWMDGFRVLKFIHFTRDHFYPSVPLMEAVDWLDKNYWNLKIQNIGKEQVLNRIREFDKTTRKKQG